MTNRVEHLQVQAALPATLALEETMILLNKSPIIVNESPYEKERKKRRLDEAKADATVIPEKENLQFKNSSLDFPAIEWYFSDCSSKKSSSDSSCCWDSDSVVSPACLPTTKKKFDSWENALAKRCKQLRISPRKRLVRSHSIVAQLSKFAQERD